MALPTEKPSFGVLDGLKVVYSAVEIAVPSACAIMGEWGADVTWLENVWGGDSMRDTTWVKEMERRNMRSVAINQFTENGKKIFLDIIKDADIFIEGSKGPTWARKGLTDEVLWEVNPKLVIVHVSGFGQWGDAERIKAPAYDLSVAAYSGMIYQNGSPEQPMNISPYGGDYFNTLMVISASLAALQKAQRTGKGESVDVAMYETLLRVGSYYMMDYMNEGTLYPRAGNRHQNLCAIGEFECKDGYIGICCYGVVQNKYLLECIGLGHLWGTEHIPEDCAALWLTNPHADEIQNALTQWFKTQNAKEVEKDLVAHRIAAQVVNDFDMLLAEDHVKQRECFIEWENAEGKTVKGLNTFPKFGQTPGQFWRPTPGYGHDTKDVLRKAGYSDEEIAAFAEEGTIVLEKE